jgi:hypothetical protein
MLYAVGVPITSNSSRDRRDWESVTESGPAADSRQARCDRRNPHLNALTAPGMLRTRSAISEDVPPTSSTGN